jgi:hypothetical protein
LGVATSLNFVTVCVHEALSVHDMLILGYLRQQQQKMEENNWYIEKENIQSGVSSLRVRQIDNKLRVGLIEPTDNMLSNQTLKTNFYKSRQYSVLDYIFFYDRENYRKCGFPEITGGFQNTQGFNQQIETIRKVNILSNSGFLKSDLYGLTALEKAEFLIMSSTDYQAQVDHVYGQASGGSNCYSNARVISGALNKALNDQQKRQEVESDLKQKWGLTSNSTSNNINNST